MMPAPDFLLYPENADFLANRRPYPVNIQGGRWQFGCQMLLLLPFIAAALFLLAFTVHTARGYILLNTERETIMGRVIDREIDNDGEGTVYRLRYEFYLNDVRFTDSQQVTNSVYEQYPLEAPIEIEYAASDPNVSNILGTDQLGLDLFLLTFTVCWVSIVGAVIVGLLGSNRRNRRLRQHGTPIPARITSLKGKLDSEGDFIVDYIVQFTAPDTGLLINAAQSTVCNHYKKVALPSAPVTAMVYYVNPKVWEVL